MTVAPAGEVIDGLEGRTLLHAGPPIDWERVCDPQRRALVAACLLEGWAADRSEAPELLDVGEVRLRSGNEHGHVGPMTGVCSPSMPVWVVQDEASGTRAFSTLNEGPGRTLWFGVGDDEAIERARFLRDRAGPLLARLLERTGPIDVLDLAAQGLQMGDELHMRSQAATNLLWRRLLPAFAAEGGEDVAAALAGNHLFFLNLVMAAAKCASLAAAGTAGSTLVDADGAQRDRHGAAGRRAAGAVVHRAGRAGPGRAPARGLLPDEAALDIGDSAVLECIGLGGMAVAAAPAVAAFFGGGAADAAARSQLMGEICAGRSARFTLPALDHAGSPVGIDARLVVELGVAPQITTGVLHATQGAGQIGAGIAHQPLEPFRDALAALVDGPGVSDRGDRGARPRPAARRRRAAVAVGPLELAGRLRGPGHARRACRGWPTRSLWDPARPSCGTRWWRGSRPGPRSRRAEVRSSARWGVARPAGVAGALSAERGAPAARRGRRALRRAGSGDVAARRRAALALLGRGPGLTPEGDDLLAGACITAAAVGDPLAPAPGVRELTTPLSATLLELAAAGAGPKPVHALLDLGDERWRGALRELEGLGASSGRAIALGVGAAAVALGARAARASRRPLRDTSSHEPSRTTTRRRPLTPQTRAARLLPRAGHGRSRGRGRRRADPGDRRHRELRPLHPARGPRRRRGLPAQARRQPVAGSAM